jgi:hypothetical protein
MKTFVRLAIVLIASGLAFSLDPPTCENVEKMKTDLRTFFEANIRLHPAALRLGEIYI